jgi:hypothetical protein
MSPRFFNIVYKIFLFLAGAFTVGWWALGYIIYLSPTQPNEATNQIVPINEHGTIFYITPLQDM